MDRWFERHAPYFQHRADIFEMDQWRAGYREAWHNGDLDFDGVSVGATPPSSYTSRSRTARTISETITDVTETLELWLPVPEEEEAEVFTISMPANHS